MLFHIYNSLEQENERSNYLLLYMISYPLYYLHYFYLSIYDESLHLVVVERFASSSNPES
jgi:hypothetical protein